jgi:hypothetical protein
MTGIGDISPTDKSKKGCMVAIYKRGISGELMAIRFEPKIPEERQQTPVGAKVTQTPPRIVGDSRPVEPVKTTKRRPKIAPT